MKVYLELDKNAKNDQILTKIKKFRDCSTINDTGDHIVFTLKNPLLINDKITITKIEKKYGGVPGVKKVIVSPVKDNQSELTNQVKHKNFHCFFDIDSTLTKGDGVINKKIRVIFDKMKNDNGMRIYFVSGRSIPQIIKNMDEFDTEPYGIAENGGVIIGVGINGELVFGDRTEPDVLDAYIKSHCPEIKEDIRQGYRKTERIYLQTSKITEKKFCDYVKKSNAIVGFQSSINSYHISKKNINKGTAVDKLTCELRFGPNDITIAVGDADMDESMIKNAEVGFAVGNATAKAWVAADIPLTYEHDKGIEEMYNKLLELMAL